MKCGGPPLQNVAAASLAAYSVRYDSSQNQHCKRFSHGPSLRSTAMQGLPQTLGTVTNPSSIPYLQAGRSVAPLRSSGMPAVYSLKIHPQQGGAGAQHGSNSCTGASSGQRTRVRRRVRNRGDWRHQAGHRLSRYSLL